MDSFLLENLEVFLDRTHKIIFEHQSFKLILIPENKKVEIDNQETSDIKKGFFFNEIDINAQDLLFN